MSRATLIPRFRPSTAKGVPDCFLANVRAGQPVLVALHGISRNAAEIASRFAAHPAFEGVSIVAPLFTRERFGKYQQLLTRKADETPSDVGLVGLLASLKPELGGGVERILLFGFSGGAQMAHRFAMFHPDKVARLCVVSAGWYCMPVPDLPYPYGIGNDSGQPQVQARFVDIPTAVMVGNRDTRVDASVRQDALILQHQGRNRLRRARAWVRSVEKFGKMHGRPARIRLLTLPAMSHDFSDCARNGNLIDLVAEAIF